MQFTVKDWMVDLVNIVSPDTIVTDALETMRRRYISSVLVGKPGDHTALGILTSTDISDKIVADGRNPAKTKVKDIMTTPIITIPADMPIEECARLMSKNRIHHLPVVDGDEKIIGMISATDFLVVAEAMGRTGERALRG